MQYLQRIRNYELIAFVTGFVLMAYELIGSRILSPVVGSSTYVWTSIIGVIVAALSLGYAYGGVIADKRVRAMDVAWLLLLSAITVATTVLLSQTVLDFVSSTFGDLRVQGLVASLLLFMPTSFLLGMISPYLARLRTESVTTTGTSIAGLSALNAIGGILGTFCVGFIFFGFMGSNESLWFLIALLVGASWLIAPRRRMQLRLVATVSILAFGSAAATMAAPKHTVASIDTASSRYTVVDLKPPQTSKDKDRTIRALLSGAGSAQSGIFLDNPNELAFDYTKKMAEIVHKAPHKDSILILGGGAFTLPQYLADMYPKATIDVVEIDPELVEIAKQYFVYKSPVNVRPIAKDARAFLNSNTRAYDVVLIDVYSELSIPFSLSTTEYAASLKKAVKSNGVVAVNVIGSDRRVCGDLLRSMHAAYTTQFSQHRAYPLRDQTMTKVQNILAVYSNSTIGWLPKEGSVQIARRTPFSDNFAPVEHLKQQCINLATTSVK